MTEEVNVEASPNEVLTTTSEAPKTDSPADENKTAEAPEYVYDFKFPEGFSKDDAALGDFTNWAKENKVSPEAAQKLLDNYAKGETSRVQQERKSWTDLQDKWVSDTKADKEIGGPQFMENLAVAKKAVDKFGNDKLKELFDFTGVGNNAEMVRFLYKIGKELSEDKIHVGQSGTTGARDIAKVMYPDLQ